MATEKFKIVNNKNLKSELSLLNIDLDFLLNKWMRDKIHEKWNNFKEGYCWRFPDKKDGFSLIHKNHIIIGLGSKFIIDRQSGESEKGISFIWFTNQNFTNNNDFVREDDIQLFLNDEEENENINLFCAKVRTLIKRNAQKVDLNKNYKYIKDFGFRSFKHI